MYLDEAMAYALALLALSLPLTAGVWRWFSLRKMQLAIVADTEKRKEAHMIEARRWQDTIDATAARTSGLELALGKTLDDIQTRLARIEQGREPIRRTG